MSGASKKLTWFGFILPTRFDTLRYAKHDTLARSLRSDTLRHATPQSSMFRFAHAVRFAFFDMYIIIIRMRVIAKLLEEGRFERAVYLLDDTLLHLRECSTNVVDPWKSPVEEAMVAMQIMIIVGGCNMAFLVEQMDIINNAIKMNDWYSNGEKRGKSMMFRRMVTPAASATRDVGVMDSLPDDVLFKIGTMITVGAAAA